MSLRPRVVKLERRTLPDDNPWAHPEVWTNEPDASDAYTCPTVPDTPLTCAQVCQRPGAKILVSYGDHSPANRLSVRYPTIAVTMDLDRELEPADQQNRHIERDHDHDRDRDHHDDATSSTVDDLPSWNHDRDRGDRVDAVDLIRSSDPSDSIEAPPPDPEPPPPEPETVDGIAVWLEQMHAKRQRDRARMLHRW